MVAQTLYFYNSRGYLQDGPVGATGATIAPPLTGLPGGSVNRWTGSAWVDGGADPGPGGPVINFVDRELVVTHFRMKTAAVAGSQIGDLISATRVVLPTEAGANQEGQTLWYNETRHASLASVPTPADVEPVAQAPESMGAINDAVATSDTGAFSLLSLFKRSLQYLGAMGANPAVVNGVISAATAAPATIAGLVANSFVMIAAGTVDAVSARVNSIAGTATLAFYASDDDVNLYAIEGIPAGGTPGSGSFSQTTQAIGVWNLKGSGRRKLYVVATALAGGNVSVSLAGTPNQSRVTSILRGSRGGSVSDVAGTTPTEALAVQNAGLVTMNVQIAQNASVTGNIDLGGARLAAILLPAGWDAANITFKVGDTLNGTYGDFYDDSSEIKYTSPAAGRRLRVNLADFIGIRYLQIRSGTSAAAVPQTAARTITLVLVP